MNDLKLPLSIFNESVVIKAINDYRMISSIHLSNDEKYFTLNFEYNKYDLEITKKEFENYVIDLMVTEL